MPTGPARSGYNSHRCMTHHEAVTTAGITGIFGWTSGATACHGFTARYGEAAQYVDFDEIVSGTLDGNGYAITWETWDDLVPATNRSPDDSHGPNDFSWTAQQVERQADIAAWMVDALGIPLHFMGSTREAGHAPHRLGVPNPTGDVDVGYGPDCWTSHAGKQCPGDRRILQLRDKVLPRAAVILAAVRAGRCGWLPTGDVNMDAALARTGTTPDDPDGWLMGAKEDILAAIAAVAAQVNMMFQSEVIRDDTGKISQGYTHTAANFNDVRDLAKASKVTADQVADMASNENIPGQPFNKTAANFNDVRGYGDSLTATLAALTVQVTALQQAVAQITGVAVPPVVPPKPATYTVCKGDTLKGIADWAHVTVAQLQEWNAIADPNVIIVGEVLKVTA
jgi:LysM repeat protein